MKNFKVQRRYFRDIAPRDDLFYERVTATETDVELFANKRLVRSFVEERIRNCRWDIENYIHKDPRFMTALKPIPVELHVVPIVKAIHAASIKANVGPMAAAAGAVAESIGRGLLAAGYKDVIVENGKDLFLKTTKSRSLGVFAGRSQTWSHIKIRIQPKDTPAGISISTRTAGHSVSFGCADSVIVLSKDPPLASAAATAIANKVTSKQDLDAALDFARSIKGLTGVIIILRNDLVSTGNILYRK